MWTIYERHAVLPFQRLVAQPSYRWRKLAIAFDDRRDADRFASGLRWQGHVVKVRAASDEARP